MRWTLLWLALIAVGGTALLYSKLIVWSVVAPVVTCGLVTLAFVVYLRRIEGAIPYFEIGAFCAALTFLYCAYPLVVYVVNGYSYPESADSRLALMQDRPEDLGFLAWWYVVYLICFCLAYAVARGRESLRLPLIVTPPDATAIGAILILLVATRLFFAVLGWFFDLRVSSYFDQYLVLQRLPLFVRQVAAHVPGIDLTLQMFLVIALCCARRRRYRIILFAVLLITTASHLIWPGARVALFAVILAAVAVYAFTVRRIPFRWIVAGAGVGFILMLVMGVARQDEKQPVHRLADLLAEQTEFEVIFGNAVDLRYIKYLSGGFLARPSLYWSGIFAMVPQQLLPIEKDTPAAWYVREHYPVYSEMGGGLAFGVLSEAVMGHGLVEVVWRGLLVGALFGLLHRRLMRGEVSLAFVMFYIWVTVWSYQTIRNGTFALLVLILYHFVAPLLGIVILGAVLRRSRRVARRLAPARRPAVA